MRLRVGSFNVWALPGLFSDDVPERMRAIAAGLPQLDVDVLALQEVWLPSARETLVAGGRRAGFTHPWWPASMPGGGLLVLSRVPLTDARFERFRFRGDLERLDKGEYFGGKGFVSVRIATDDGPVTLVDTHLHASYRNDLPAADSAVRIAQLLQIVEFLESRDEPAVVAGDFNFEEHSPEYRVLTGLSGLRDTAVELDRRQPTITRDNYYKRNRSGPNKRIDLLLVREGGRRGIHPLRTERIFDEPLELGDGMRAASDHFGVMCELELGTHLSEGYGGRDRGALVLARQLLEHGRAEAAQRESRHARDASYWLGASVLAGVATRHGRVNRRRFLRRLLGTGAAVALAPAAGLAALARMHAPNQVEAFDAAAATLVRLDRRFDERSA